ncbi:MAG: zinc-ribbon domain-containing protein, partial [Rhodovibrionaceae bacterium]
MHLTCPSCSATFKTDPAAFAQAPRRVRCGRCGHVWREAVAGVSAAAAEAPPPPPAAGPDPYGAPPRGQPPRRPEPRHDARQRRAATNILNPNEVS